MSKTNKLKVHWHNQDRCFSFYYEERMSFCLTQKEVDRFMEMKGATCAFMDLSRVVIVANDAIRVVRLADYLSLGYNWKGDRKIEAECFGFTCDVRKLFKLIALRIERGAFERKKFFMENEGEFTVDVERLMWKDRDESVRGVMQIINAAEEGFQREHLAKSLASFGKSLARENWAKLMAQCSRYLNDGGRLFGGGKEEINFRWMGMYGGIILRDSEYSTHT